MSQEVNCLVNDMAYNLLINGIYWGYNPLILTFDPNFQRDIQVLFTTAIFACWSDVVRSNYKEFTTHNIIFPARSMFPECYNTPQYRTPVRQSPVRQLWKESRLIASW